MRVGPSAMSPAKLGGVVGSRKVQIAGIPGIEVESVDGVAMLVVDHGVEKLRETSKCGNVLVSQFLVVVVARGAKACDFKERLGSCEHFVASRSDGIGGSLCLNGTIVPWS